MGVSGGLTITDLDDFLTPSQACIIPVRNAIPSGPDSGITEIQIDANNNYYEVSTYSTAVGSSSDLAQSRKALEKAEINLNDCLACSGCITSTESMLITLQSHNEVRSFITSNYAAGGPLRTPVLSISPQTLASLSVSYSSSSSSAPLPLLTLFRRIRSFLTREENGGWRTWDTTFARHVSLLETVAEWNERKSFADKGKQRADHSETPEPGPLPILTSACPGWVCYAEKAQGDMLPLMSSTRSSQGLMGALVKSWYGSKMGLSPSQIYHVTAMPCYDKKLEASRTDFYSSMHDTRDVDCVLTTGELDLLLAELGFDPFLPCAEEVSFTCNGFGPYESPFPELLDHQGSSSGSYLATIMRYVADDHPRPTRLVTREIRGSTDNVEYMLEDVQTGEIIFKGAKCYGFRNLQNLVRKVGKETGISKSARGGSKLSAVIAARRRKAKTGHGEVMTPTTPTTENEAETVPRLEKKLDFVEVMACPSGCVNGGGQMKPVSFVKALDEEGYERPLPDDGDDAMGVEKPDEGLRWSTKEWVNNVEAIYWTGLPTPPPSPPLDGRTNHANGNGRDRDARLSEADKLADSIVHEVAGDDTRAKWEFLRTRFRKVEGDVLTNGGLTHEAVKW